MKNIILCLNNRNSLIQSSVTFFLVVLFYTPIFFQTYGYLNDYMVFEYQKLDCCFSIVETKQLLAIGRPIQSILLNIQSMFVNSIHSLELVRLFYVVMIGFGASLFFSYIHTSLNINRYSAILLSFITFTLPSMSINSFWVTQSIPGILPLFLIIPAHFLFHRIGKIHLRKLHVIFVPFLLLFISLTIYQPTTFFYLTLTFIRFLFGSRNSKEFNLKDVVSDIVFLGTTCIFYFLLFKFFYKPMLISSSVGGIDFEQYFYKITTEYPAYEFSFSFDVFSKLHLVKDLINILLSGWFPLFSDYLLIPTSLIFLGILIWASFFNSCLKKLRIPHKVIVGVVTLSLLILLTGLPMIVGKGDYTILYRSSFATMSILPAVIVFVIERVISAGKRRKEFYPVLLSCVILITLAQLSSFYRLLIQTQRLSAEYSHVINVIKNYKLTESEDILVPPFVSSSKYNSKFLQLDFGYTSVNSVTDGMVNSAAQELGLQIAGLNIFYEPKSKYIENINNAFKFNRAGTPNFISNIKGLSTREDFGRWTDSNETVFEFTDPLPRKFNLVIKAGTSTELVKKDFRVKVGKNVFITNFPTQEASLVSIPIITDGLTRSIIFDFGNIKSPYETGTGVDTRRLGLALISLRIDQET